MNKQLLVAPFVLILALFGLGAGYGFDVFGDIVSGLFHEIIDVVILLFIVGIFLTLFSAPLWIRRVFGGFNT